MTIKKFVLSLLFICSVFCIAFSLVQTVNATKYPVVDEGFGSVKDSNVTKLHWKVYSSHNNVKILNQKLKGNSTVSIMKISIKKIKNKLKITSSSFKNGVLSEKESLVKSKLSPKSYYFKVYQSKMLKNVVKTKIFDRGGETLSNVPHGHINWKAYIYHGNKVLVTEYSYGLYQSSNKTAVIEKFGKKKLKITEKISNKGITIHTLEGNLINNSNNKKTIKYIKTSLNPQDYYFNVYKTKMFKNILKIEMFERSYGLLKDSGTKLYWKVYSHMNKKFIKDKLTIIRGFSLENMTYDQTTIEIFSNQLKITFIANNTTEITYINSKLLPMDYYYNIYRPEMIKIYNKSTIGTIVGDW